MVEIKLLLIPIIGFFIGYFTNYIAIKMLFHPKKPIFGFRGVIPKRRKIIAKKIGEISEDLLPIDKRKIEKIPLIGSKLLTIYKSSVEKKVNSLSDEELEEIIFKVAKKELGLITFLGGIIGFFIGFLQILVIIL